MKTNINIILYKMDTLFMNSENSKTVILIHTG